MELSIGTQKRIFIKAIIGTAVFLLCDFCAYKDWFGVNEIKFIRDSKPYSLGDIIFNSNDFLLIGFLFLGLKRATKQIAIAQYFFVLMMEVLLVSIVYTILFSPDVDSWSRWSWIMVNIVVFVLTCLLNKKYPIITKLNLWQ